eukprot:gene13670-18521_t
MVLIAAAEAAADRAAPRGGRTRRSPNIIRHPHPMRCARVPRGGAVTGGRELHDVDH